MELTIVVTGNNINITKDKFIVIINKDKSTDLYNKILDKLNTNLEDAKIWITNNFKSFKEEVEGSSSGLFVVDRDKVRLKGTDTLVPRSIIKKFKELEDKKESILPLVRFWKKLLLNPDKSSREDLYGFIEKWNIPITEEGDFVMEKGVNQLKGSHLGHLVDVHSKSVDNSIGMLVEMPRDKVNKDSNQTCSHGLHVGAPDYVRHHWSSDIIVECIVNPKDVVSIPKDYNSTKMRVCSYKVVGYSPKTVRRGDMIVKMTDFFTTPNEEVKHNLEKANNTKNPDTLNENENVESKKISYKNLEDMTAREIVDFIRNKTGVEIKISLKSKKAIFNKAKSILESEGNTQLELLVKDVPIGVDENLMKVPYNERKEIIFEDKILDLNNLSKEDLLNVAKVRFNEDLSYLYFKNLIEFRLIKLAKNAGYKIIRNGRI